MLWCQQIYHNTTQSLDWNGNEGTPWKFFSTTNWFWQEFCQTLCCLATFLMFKGDICHRQVLEESLGCSAGIEKFLEKWETWHVESRLQFKSAFFAQCLIKNIGLHPSVHFSIALYSALLEPLPALLGQRRGYSLRQFITGLNRDKQPFTVKLTPTANLELPISLVRLTVPTQCTSMKRIPT